MNGQAQSKVAKARDSALAAEQTRQSQYDREAQQINTRSQDRYTDFAGQEGERADKLGDYFSDQKVEQGSSNQQAAEDMAAAALPQSSSNLVVANEAQERGDARSFTDAQGQALGELRAFGDLLGGIGRTQARDASLIGQIGGFKRGSSATLPYALEEASKAGDGMKMFGDILGLGGSVAGAAGVNGGSLSGLFGAAPKATNVTMAGSALDRAADRASVAGYSALRAY